MESQRVAELRALLPEASRVPSESFQRLLKEYRDETLAALFEILPKRTVPYLYDLISVYPSRQGKGLRSALCLATCRAFGGTTRRAINTAVAIELFHNAFLIHDDVEDGSLSRRGGASLHSEYGVGIAVNVGDATNLLALQCLLNNRRVLGPETTWRISEETEVMLQQSLEGQAIELGWIRDNELDLTDADYFQMCLKKSSWYTCIYPCRMGSLIAGRPPAETAQLYRFCWYLGAAFQIQDDVLNLTGNFDLYGKETAGDLWEGKRTLMLIHLLRSCRPSERVRIGRFLALARRERTEKQVAWLRRLIDAYGSLDYASRCARRLAGAALLEGLNALRFASDPAAKRFLLEMPLFVVARDR
jgi:geranylgeranyl diphosphate synthase type II